MDRRTPCRPGSAHEHQTGRRRHDPHLLRAGRSAMAGRLVEHIRPEGSKPMPTVEERARYQSDFGVSWLRLPILTAIALVTAIAVAWCLKSALVHGWYLIILVPGVGGALLAGVLYALVGWAHCRNCWLASAIAVVAGLVTYLGYYHFALVDALPAGNAWRVDLLPEYILIRLQTDVAEDV